MLIDRSSRIRVVRLLFIIGILFAFGFSVTGFIIKEWAFAFTGLLSGLLFLGMALGFNHLFQRKDSYLIFSKFLRPALYIFLAIQILLVLINLSVG